MTASILNDAQSAFHAINSSDGLFYLHKATNSLIPADNPIGRAVGALLGERTEISAHQIEFDTLLQRTSLLLQSKTPPESEFREVTDLSISPTLNCNLNCTYCYNYIEGQQSAIRKMPSLDRAGIRNILNALSKLPLSRTLRICFIGGEPFLDPVRLRRLLGVSDHYCRKTGRTAYYFVTTNGINLSAPLVRRLISDFRINVSISFDGPRDWHNETRKLLNGKGSFDRLKVAVDDFLQYYPPSVRSARATVKLEPGRLLATYRFLVDWGFNDISLGSADFATPDAAGIVTSSMPGVLSELESLQRQVVCDFLSGKLKRHSWYTETFTNLYYGIYKNRVCGATKNHLAFDVYGRMQPCHRFLGNMEFELSAEDVLHRDASDLVQKIVGHGETTDCNRCWARGLCGGECFHVGRDISRRSDHQSRQALICKFKRKQYLLAIEAYIQICQRDMSLMSRLVEREEDVFAPNRPIPKDSVHPQPATLD
ncbi:radical SAM protein [Niveibacterium sp.]|uniref:radical SAM protein n=1 Tax=Niveibacterium sp. TaxID=2017444 RepID=UPI0035B11D5E